MRIVPIAVNHLIIELESGVTLDVNDGTASRSGGILALKIIENPKKMKIEALAEGGGNIRILIKKVRDA